MQISLLSVRHSYRYYATVTKYIPKILDIHRYCLHTMMLPILLLLQVPILTVAWGKNGHEIVSNIAYRRLSRTAQSAVKSILGVEADEAAFAEAGAVSKVPKPDPLHDESPLAAVANWADKVRFTSEYHWSFQLHFVDVSDDEIDGGCRCIASSTQNYQSSEKGTTDAEYCVKRSASKCWVDYERDCKEGACAIGAIANYTHRLQQFGPDLKEGSKEMLRGSRAPLWKNGWYAKEALMFITHFVGDVHQPLHSSRGSDRGGNSIHVSIKDFDLYESRNNFGKGTKAHLNLHSVWDDGIIDYAITGLYNSSAVDFEVAVQDLVTEAESSGLIDVWLRCADGLVIECPLLWAEESLEDALGWAYSNEDGVEIVDGAVLTSAYFDTRLHVVKRRLAAAGVRLAALLEIVLGGNDGGGVSMYAQTTLDRE